MVIEYRRVSKLVILFLVSEDNDGGSSSQGREKYWDYFQGDFGKQTHYYQQGGYELQPPHLLKDYGYMKRSESQRYKGRHNPYDVQHNKRGMKLRDEGCGDVTVWRGRKPLEEEVENTQDETTERWFKIIIPYGRKYEKTWLMDSIQRHCSVPFTPVEFHYVKNRAQFFVRDARAAYALKDISYKICDEENWKIAIFVRPSAVPCSVWDKLAPEEMEQLKLAMRKRYDVPQKALDLRSFLYDPGFAHLDIDIILNRRNCMAATLQVIKENFPELLSLNLRNNRLNQLDGLSDIIQMVPTVKILNLSKNELKSTWELDKIKGLKLEELWLEDNPLCDTFQSQFTYVSAIRKYFPNLLRLDGQDLPPQIATDIDKSSLISPPIKVSCEILDAMKRQVVQFLQQYYSVYDSGDRQGLLGAYHDEACFSLTTPFIQDNPALSLFVYFKDNRNMKNLQDPNLRFQLLRHTKRDIVSSLCVIPKTQHDINSFLVDMWLQSERMLCICVHGVFKEVEGRSQGSVRAFTRTFITTPASDSSIFIVNDELFVRDATLGDTQRAISIPVPTPSCSTGPTLSQEQQEMVQIFSIQSGMKPQWSQMCLQDNEWNYIKAAQVFTTLKAQGKIPEEAFKQTS
ncbi:PREDICTED: nuclear RNA export factor 2 [Myotis davidii]|uniref:nuclear RNA export factor 2 n=1 Tax=Myotis davidii TaxID=225400 RepID=UPI000766FEB4|nr:PREDICTED: nuclear RNA export factor 2 [Myotis davidii]